MLHTKYFEVLNEFLGNFSREIYGRELVGKINQSQKSIALTLNELENMGVLESKLKGNMKFFSLNKQNLRLLDLLIETEIERKYYFLITHKKLEYIFRNDTRLVGIFGSYAKGKEKQTSDVDVFIIGEKKKEDYDYIGKKFDLTINIIYLNDLDKNIPLIREIIENHIILFGFEKWFQLNGV